MMKSVTLSLLQSAANAFDFGGPVLCDAHHYGEGHINDTFVVWREDHSKRFILQRINTDTFTNPVGLMENVCGVTRHLRAKILAEGGDPARETLNVVPTLSGSTCYLDADGGAWRAYDFVEDTICLQQVGSEADFRTVAETLGKFQIQRFHFDLAGGQIDAGNFFVVCASHMQYLHKNLKLSLQFVYVYYSGNTRGIKSGCAFLCETA